MSCKLSENILSVYEATRERVVYLAAVINLFVIGSIINMCYVGYKFTNDASLYYQFLISLCFMGISLIMSNEASIAKAMVKDTTNYANELLTNRHIQKIVDINCKCKREYDRDDKNDKNESDGYESERNEGVKEYNSDELSDNDISNTNNKLSDVKENQHELNDIINELAFGINDMTKMFEEALKKEEQIKDTFRRIQQKYNNDTINLLI